MIATILDSPFARVGLFALGLYLFFGAVLYVAQRSLIFPAPDVPRAQLDKLAQLSGTRTLDLVAEDGVKLYGWHVPASGERAVLFFPGNAETVARLDLHRQLVELGWDVVIVAYRGYPGSEGSPSQTGLVQDARAAWAYATETLGIPPERIVIHGKSLGGGVASQLAAQKHPAALVLESTFTSIRDVAGGRFPIYPAVLLVRDPFLTRELTLDMPMLIAHDSGDGVVPVGNGRALAQIFEQATYVEVSGHHHGASLSVDAPEVRAAYEDLLAGVGGE